MHRVRKGSKRSDSDLSNTFPSQRWGCEGDSTSLSLFFAVIEDTKRSALSYRSASCTRPALLINVCRRLNLHRRLLVPPHNLPSLQSRALIDHQVRFGWAPLIALCHFGLERPRDLPGHSQPGQHCFHHFASQRKET